MIQAGDREQASVIFVQEIVMISPSEVVAMKARPSWPALVASIDSADSSTCWVPFRSEADEHTERPDIAAYRQYNPFAATQASDQRVDALLTVSKLGPVRRSATQRHGYHSPAVREHRR
jgi:hypothetical protein